MTLENLFSLETPESIEIEFSLVGPGTRFCAAIVDMTYLVILTVAIFILWLVAFAGASASLGRLFDDAAGGVIDFTSAILIIALFLLFSGYHLFFEWWMNGQTPGKRHFKIRAVRDNGTPMGGTDLLIRNLLRPVDFLPFFYVLGGTISLFHPMHKRLGDLAAGTIVVNEEEIDYRGRTDKKYEVAERDFGGTNPELTPKEVQVLRGFLSRREELLPEAREALANRLAGPLHEKYGGSFFDAESYIEKLIEGRQYEA